MDVIDYEIDEINKIIERVINNAKIIVCMKTLIRIHIKQTDSRQITICLRFPSDYPNDSILLVELKSATISGKLLAALTAKAEQKANEFLGKPQSLHVLKFIDNYLNENPLCVAYDEIATIKTLLRQKSDSTTVGGELKCLQKTSSISLTVNSDDYYYKIKLRIPEAYPMECIGWIEHRTNFPVTLARFLTGQAKEIARKCTEPPLRASSQSKFEVKPSLLPTAKFLIEAVFDFPHELCPVCSTACLPANANDVEACDTADQYVERVYCGHIYHLGCLRKYMKEPPFPPGGKTCPAKKIHPRSDQDKESNQVQQIKKMTATTSSTHLNKNTCGVRIAHDRWALNVSLAEARWALQQARERELEEVKDFLQ